MFYRDNSAIYSVMKLQFKKLLVNALVLMVVMLPFREAFAMPLQLSSKHCSQESMTGEMPMMNHVGHNMVSPNPDQEQQSNCGCCAQCDSDCTGCAHISAITFNLTFLSELNTTETVLTVSDASLTRTVSPPSRPPLVL